MANRTAAIVYDFDDTLAEGNIQEHSFIPQLGIEKAEFWSDVGEQARKHDADPILVYMWRMLEVARSRKIAVTRNAMIEHCRATPRFEGVDSSTDGLNARNPGRSFRDSTPRGVLRADA